TAFDTLFTNSMWCTALHQDGSIPAGEQKTYPLLSSLCTKLRQYEVRMKKRKQPEDPERAFTHQVAHLLDHSTQMGLSECIHILQEPIDQALYYENKNQYYQQQRDSLLKSLKEAEQDTVVAPHFGYHQIKEVFSQQEEKAHLSSFSSSSSSSSPSTLYTRAGLIVTASDYQEFTADLHTHLIENVFQHGWLRDYPVGGVDLARALLNEYKNQTHR